MIVLQHVMLLVAAVGHAHALVVQVLQRHQQLDVAVVAVLLVQHVEQHALLVLLAHNNAHLHVVVNAKGRVKVRAPIAVIPHVSDNVLVRAQQHVEATVALPHAMVVVH